MPKHCSHSHARIASPTQWITKALRLRQKTARIKLYPCYAACLDIAYTYDTEYARGCEQLQRMYPQFRAPLAARRRRVSMSIWNRVARRQMLIYWTKSLSRSHSHNCTVLACISRRFEKIRRASEVVYKFILSQTAPRSSRRSSERCYRDIAAIIDSNLNS